LIKAIETVSKRIQKQENLLRKVKTKELAKKE
jgi:hypothetical protein